MRSYKSRYQWLLPLLLILCPVLCLAFLLAAADSSGAPTVSIAVPLSEAASDLLPSKHDSELSPHAASSTANALKRHDPRVALNLTSDLLLDYSSRSRASTTSHLLQNLCAQPASQRENVQQCHVFGYGSLANWTQFTQGLPCLPNLKDIHWQNISPMPRMKDFFERELPGTCLHIDIGASRDTYNREMDVRETNFTSLAGLANLKTLKTHIAYGSQPEQERIGVVHQLLATCSNVRNLDLTFSHGGCIVSSGQPRAFNFKDAPFSNATLPLLQRLKLNWYNYHDTIDGKDRLMWYWPSPERLLWPFSRISPEQLQRFVPPPMLYSLQESKEWLYGQTAPSWLLTAYEKLTGDRAAPVPARCCYPCCEPHNRKTINLDAWMDRMSFENIENLEIDNLDTTVASRLFVVLDAVTNLTIHYADQCASDALLDHLQFHHQPLSAFHLPHVYLPKNSLSVLLDALEPSRSNLLALTLPSALESNHTDLKRLANTFSNLSTLTLHHPRILPLFSPAISTNVTTNTNTSSTNTSTTTTTTPPPSTIPFPSLHTLTLHIPSPGSLYGTTHDPLFNKSSLESQLRHSLPPTLRRLEVLLGTWSRRHESSLSGPPDEVVGRYVCERGAEGVVTSPFGSAAEDGNGDEDVVRCSGGLTSPSYYGSGPRVMEGRHAGAVMRGDAGEGIDEDEEGRKIGEDGWVRWDDDWEDLWGEGGHREGGHREGDLFRGEMADVDGEWIDDGSWVGDGDDDEDGWLGEG